MVLEGAGALIPHPKLHLDPKPPRQKALFSNIKETQLRHTLTVIFWNIYPHFWPLS